MAGAALGGLNMGGLLIATDSLWRNISMPMALSIRCCQTMMVCPRCYCLLRKFLRVKLKRRGSEFMQTLWRKGAVTSIWVAQTLFIMFPCLHQVLLRQGRWTLECCKSHRHRSSEDLASHTSWRPLIWTLASFTLTSPFTDLWISSSRNSLFLFYILFSIPTKLRLSSPGCLQTWLLPTPGISRLSINVLIYV